MEILDVVIPFLTAILGGLTTLWLAKRIMFSRENVMETVDSVLEYALNTVEGQMKVKAVMEQIGNSLMKTVKIPGLSGMGKNPKLTDILVMVGMGYAQKMGWLPSGVNQPQNQQEERKTEIQTQ